MNRITVYEQKKTELIKFVEGNKQELIARIGDRVDQFKDNFGELARNDYLVNTLPTKQVFDVAIKATQMGLSINPVDGELYILPFNTQLQGQEKGVKEMRASIVLTKQGVRQLAYQNGFFLEIDEVWNIDGKEMRESEMTLSQQAKIDSTNKAFFDEHFKGWVFTLKDISNIEPKLHDQTKFVEIGYAKTATKTLKAEEFKKQTYSHKAARYALKSFFMPRDRNFINKVDDADSEVIEAEAEPAPAQQIADPLKELSQQEANISEAVAVRTATVEEIKKIYQSANKEAKAKMSEKMEGTGWNTSYSPEQLGELADALEELL